MKFALLIAISACLLACSKTGPSPADAQQPDLPEDVRTAWVEVEQIVNAFHEELDESQSGWDLSARLLAEDSVYTVAVDMDINPEPMSTQGFENPNHLRKSEAWFWANLFGSIFVSEIDKHRVFHQIDFTMTINNVLIKVNSKLSINDDQTPHIELYDSVDKRTFRWPKKGKSGGTGLDHWCFNFEDNCEECRNASILYDPFKDE